MRNFLPTPAYSKIQPFIRLCRLLRQNTASGALQLQEIHVMKTFLSVATAVSLALSLTSFACAQHYTQVNLVANASGVAPVTDPNLVNPVGTFPHFRQSLVGLRQWHWPEHPLQRRRSHHSTRRDHSQSQSQQHDLPHRHSHRHHRQRQSHRLPSGSGRTRRLSLLHH